MSDRDDEIQQDRLLDAMEKVAQRDHLHWDTNRGLIHERARAALAAADAAQPADDRRMVDLDAACDLFADDGAISSGKNCGEYPADVLLREFGGSAPSEDQP